MLEHEISENFTRIEYLADINTDLTGTLLQIKNVRE